MCMLTLLTLWPIYLETNFLSLTENNFIFSKIIRIFCHGNIQFLLCAYINYWLKKLKKRYQEKWENVHLTVKNARASKALRRALDPGRYMLTWSLADISSLRSLSGATSHRPFPPKKNLGPPPSARAGSATGYSVRFAYHEKPDDATTSCVLRWMPGIPWRLSVLYCAGPWRFSMTVSLLDFVRGWRAVYK